jgi:TolB-like protein
MLAVGSPPLVGDRNAIGLQPGSFRVDLLHLMDAVALQEVPDVLLRQERLAEALLAGFDDLDPSFHSWLTARRQTLHDSLVRGLEAGYRDRATPRWRRRRMAEAVLLLDPTHEAACRVLMQCAAEDGEIGAALRTYNELYELLGTEYDQEPSAATQELVATIKQGKFDTVAPEAPQEDSVRLSLVAPRRTSEAPPPSSAAPAKPALFIDNFAINGVPSERAYLVSGFRVELIACLTRFREWYVSGSPGVKTDDRAGVPISSRYFLSTTTYQAGASINVTMVLEEQPSGVAIWGERFELRLDQWFDAQQRIVRRIAATLNVQISVERLMQLAHVPARSLEAYDIWLRAQTVINGYQAGEWNRALDLLTRTIEREPGFSPLYSSLAQMNNVVPFVQPGLFRTMEMAQGTLNLARRAVALDPRDSRAELCLGWALAFCRSHSHAQLHMEIACELNSNDSWTLMSAAMFHAFNGDFERAARLSSLSMELTLSPTLSHWAFLASIRYLLGDNEGAVVAADRAQSGLLSPSAWRAAALHNLGQQEEARREVSGFFASLREAWIGDAQPTDEMIGKWLLALYPFSQEETWRRLRDGIAAVGIPVTGCVFEGTAES